MFRGIYAPIPTPFNRDGEIEWPSLRDNLKWWGQSSLQGLVVAGTNGEAALLDWEEKVKLFSFVREFAPAGKKVIAGTGCESAKATERLNRAATDCGADAVLVLNPSYFKGSMNDDLLKNYYFHIAENSSLPVMLYNMPRNTALNMSSKLVCALSEHPNIVGIKDSSGNIVQIGEIINNTAKDFSLFAGSANFLLPALVLGAVGGTLALANIMPEECVKIQKHFDDGDLNRAKEMQLSLLEINDAVTARWGVAGLKAALDQIGLYGGPPRLPLLALTAEEIEQLKEIMRQNRFF